MYSCSSFITVRFILILLILHPSQLYPYSNHPSSQSALSLSCSSFILVRFNLLLFTLHHSPPSLSCLFFIEVCFSLSCYHSFQPALSYPVHPSSQSAPSISCSSFIQVRFIPILFILHPILILFHLILGLHLSPSYLYFVHSSFHVAM